MSEVMMNLSLNSQLLQQALDTGSRISGTAVKPQGGQPNYAVKGDDAYIEAMDIDGDGTITYDEYMEYCKKNAVSHNNESGKTLVQRDADTVRPLHVGRAFESYARAEASGLPQSMIFNEA